MDASKVVIVTGASRGLGAAVARWIARAAGRLTLVARSETALNALAAEIRSRGGRVLVFPADVADPQMCRRAVEATLETYGRLDTLVNNAGIVEPLAMTVSADPHAWRRNIEVNLMGPFHLAQAVLPSLRKRRGRIINVSSGAGKVAIQGAGAYCAAKAAVTHLTRVLAAEEPLVTSIAVRPGVVDTGMQETLRREGPGVMPAEQAAYYRDLHNRGLLEPPEVPGRAIAWLALHAPRAYSGRFMDYDDPTIAGPAAAELGDSL